MVNKHIIIGHLGHAPRVYEDAGKTPRATFSVASKDTWREQGGERRERTDWHDVVVWGERWVTVAKMMRKGSHVYVEGSSQKRKYTGKDGVQRTVSEIVLSGFRGDIRLLDNAPGSGAAPPPEDPGEYGVQRDPYGGHGGNPQAPLDDEYPSF